MPRQCKVFAAAALVLAVALWGQLGANLELSGTEAARDSVIGETDSTDIGQDLIGARRLLNDGDPYPSLRPAMKQEYGRWWSVEARSTHPPTAFLFVLPLVGLPWAWAVGVWSAATFGLLVVCARLAGVSWLWALASLVAWVLWQPSAWGNGQYVAIWLLGALLAWRWRDRPGLAGAAIGVATMTKLLPAVLLVLFIRRRQWSAVAAFAAVCTGGVALVGALNFRSLTRYAAIIGGGAEEQVGRLDNGGLFVVASHDLGPAGVVAVGLLVVAVAVFGARSSRLDEWTALLWVGVALLPVGWIYSLVPLVPIIVRSVRSRVPVAVMAGAVSAVLPMLVAPFAPTTSARMVGGVIALTGVAVIAISRSGDLADHHLGEHLRVGVVGAVRPGVPKAVRGGGGAGDLLDPDVALDGKREPASQV